MTGCRELKATDHIHLFYTKNARKIDLNIIDKHGDAELVTHEVPPGKQSADIHIGSYLGYLAGVHREDGGCRVIVISNDTDYDNVLKFWAEEARIKTGRSGQIGQAGGEEASGSRTGAGENGKIRRGRGNKAEQDQGTGADAKESGKNRRGRKTDKDAAPVTDAKKMAELDQKIRRAVGDAGFEEEVCGEVADIAARLAGKEDFVSDVHNELQEMYFNYKEVYDAVRPVLTEFSGGGKSRSRRKRRS